jgi:hypothetical protein
VEAANNDEDGDEDDLAAMLEADISASLITEHYRQVSLIVHMQRM